MEANLLLQNLKKILVDLPQVKYIDYSAPEPLENNSEFDAKFEIETKKGKKIRLFVKTKAAGYPRDLERNSRLLKDFIENIKNTKNAENQNNGDSVALVASDSISPGSRKMLQEQEIGYFDKGGSLYLPYSDGVFFIDRPVAAKERRLQNIYEGKSAQVLHILLDKIEKQWHVNEMAEQARVSPYTVHHVFSNLEGQSIMARCGKGPESVRILENPGELLDVWEENYSYKHYAFKNYYKWARSYSALRGEIAKMLEEREVNYALTLGSGAELVAPFSTANERLYFIVEESIKLDDVIKSGELEPVDDGAVVTFLTTKSGAPLLNRRKVSDLWVASSVQLYLDLSKWRARGREQAEHLRRELLKY